MEASAQVEDLDAARQLRIRVRDHGRWPEPAQYTGYRGFGLALMHELTQQVVIDRREVGSEVMVLTTAVPAPN